MLIRINATKDSRWLAEALRGALRGAVILDTSEIGDGFSKVVNVLKEQPIPVITIQAGLRGNAKADLLVFPYNNSLQINFTQPDITIALPFGEQGIHRDMVLEAALDNLRKRKLYRGP